MATATALDLDELGRGVGIVVDDLHRRLQDYDIVFTTGRMALEALASGCAVVLGDARGVAGLVTSNVVDTWRRQNFGSGLFDKPYDVATLTAEIARYNSADARAVAVRIRETASLSAHLDTVETIHRTLLDNHSTSDPERDLVEMSRFYESLLRRLDEAANIDHLEQIKLFWSRRPGQPGHRPRKRVGKTVKRGIKGVAATVALLAAVYLAACGYLFVFQRDYVFKPSGTLAAPAEEGLPGVEVITLSAKDGTELTGWHQAAKPSLPTVLYFHGNAGNVSERSDRFRQIVGSGFGFLAMSYRGYAGSGGSPNETALVSDGIEAFDWLAERSDSIVIHGESLGTGVAVEVAAARQPRALILEAPFTAALDIAAATYPWVPVGWLMRDPFLSREHITQVHAPVLIIHGTADAVIPVEEGERLFAVAKEPKELLVVEGATHSDLWERGLWPIVTEFLAKNGVAVQPAP